MENKNVQPEKYQAMKLVCEEFESLNNQEYADLILSTVRLLLEATNSLHKENVPLPSWMQLVEPVIFKLCFQTSSLLRLYHGTVLPYQRDSKDVIVFDEPTVNTLFRSLLENYLTNFYLFIEGVSEAEKEFRVTVWKFSGAKQRVEFEVKEQIAIAKRKSEMKVVESLQQIIEDSPFFLAFKKDERKKVLSGVKPRLFNSWTDLIKRSNLRVSWYKNMYGFHSNYSHSEFISILQFNDGQFGHHPNNTKGHYLLMIIHSLIGKTIVDLASAFPSISKYIFGLDKTIRFRIEYLAELSSNGSTEYHPD